MLWSRGFRRRSGLSYTLACLLVGLAIGVRLLLGEALPGAPFITIFPAVILATHFGGLWPGVLAVALGGVGAWYFLLPPVYSFAFESTAEPVSLLIYLGVAGFQCLVINWLISIAEQNASLADRNDLLLRELRHRVKNHLQLVSALLNLQAARAGGDVREALLDARRRLDVITSLYANTSDPTAEVDVAEHLQTLCKTAQEGFGQGNCEVSVSAPPQALIWSMDRIMPLSLVVNELLTNAFRHGLAQGRGRIEVMLRGANGRFELSVADDGGRLPADFDLAGTGGLGLAIARRLAAEMDGDLGVVRDSRPRFVLTFPAREPPAPSGGGAGSGPAVAPHPAAPACTDARAPAAPARSARARRSARPASPRPGR